MEKSVSVQCFGVDGTSGGNSDVLEFISFIVWHSGTEFLDLTYRVKVTANSIVRTPHLRNQFLRGLARFLVDELVQSNFVEYR